MNAAARGFCYRSAYRALWIFCNVAFRVYFRLRVENRPSLSGPCVLVANHVSHLDPLLLASASTRRCVFMMTEAFYRNPRSEWFYRFFRSIPVALRGGNREAIRAARTALADGEMVTVFPEGGISRDGQLLLGSPGAVALVLSEGVPVVPAAIVGAYEAFPVAGFPRPVKVTVRFGDPIPADDLTGDAAGPRKERLARATERIMTAIAELSGQRAREDQLRALRAGDKV